MASWHVNVPWLLIPGQFCAGGDQRGGGVGGSGGQRGGRGERGGGGGHGKEGVKEGGEERTAS